MMIFLQKYLKDERAVVALLVGLIMPVIIISSGIAYDLAAAYNVRNRLANAVDKAALAVAASDGDQAQLEAVMNKFFEANFPEDKLGLTLNVSLSLVDDKVNVSGSVRSDNSFMSILGFDYINVYAKSVVSRQLTGVEAVLVLDVTGSMAGSRITELRRSAASFVNIMFENIYSIDDIKIGIVPYANTVNVGPYGLGRNLLNQVYDTPFVSRPTTDPFVSPTSNINYTSSNSTTSAWRGCILERNYPLDTTDDSSPNWQMYRYPPQCTSTRNGVCQTWRNDPNYLCPTARLVPLTNNQTQLLNTINNLSTSGNTYGNVGMAWGWRVISPEFPFTEGADWDDTNWRKVVIMMTDGDNTMNNFYSAYGRTANHSITASHLDDRFAEICDNMKEKGVIIYTITFSTDIDENTKDYYRACATTESKYYDVKTNAELLPAFQEIARQLSRIHITE
jgi:Flp pilus assembly protein TadG